MTTQWFETTAKDLTSIMAAVMNINKGMANKIVNAAVGKLGFAGTTAGTFGIASLIGTAGTGTAIGTLHGAAATSATLAWIGGSVFTGTIVLFGIAAAGGWATMRLWKKVKGKPREYDDLYESEQRIVTACANLAKAFKEQVEAGTVPNKATMKVVIEEGLLPLLKELEEYLRPRNPEGPSLRTDFRVRFRMEGLKRRVAEAM